MCDNHSVFKLHQIRTKKKRQFAVYISDTPVTLKQSQGHQIRYMNWEITYTSHTKTILPMGKSVPRSRRQTANRTTQKAPDYRKEMQTEVVQTCLLFNWSGRNHLARHSGREKKTRQTEKDAGKQHQGMDRPGVCQVQESGGKQRKMEETGCEVICDAPTTSAVMG